MSDFVVSAINCVFFVCLFLTAVKMTTFCNFVISPFLTEIGGMMTTPVRVP